MFKKDGKAPDVAVTQTTLKFRGIRKDGGEEVTIEVPINHSDRTGLDQGKAQMLMTFHQLGGLVKDDKDGFGATLYPMHLFDRIVIEANSIVVAHPLVSLN